MKLKMWWKAWSELFLKFISLVASLASLVGLLLTFLPSPVNLPWWAIGLLILALVFFLWFAVMEVISYQGRRVYAKNDIKGIRNYMHKWIQHGGRVAIWTRDMTWADNPGTRKLLKEKASRKELILCLPEQNELTRELGGCPILSWRRGGHSTVNPTRS